MTPPAAWEPTDWDVITSRDVSNWLRVVFYDAEAGEDAEAVDHLRTSTRDALHTLKRLAGFRVGYWGHDPVDGTMAAVTYWGGLDYIAQANALLETIHTQREEHGGAISDVLNLQLLNTEAVPAGATGWLPKRVGAA